MNLLEVLLASVGLSLDVYAVVICQGALLLKIERKKLFNMCLIFCAWQMGAVLLGNMITWIPYLRTMRVKMQHLCYGFAMIIFFSLAVYMLYKAWRNEQIFEQLSEIKYSHICRAALVTSLDALLAGMSFGFLGAQLIEVMVIIGIVTAAFVILGLYTGYRLGYEQKTKTYGIGGILLLISGLDVIFNYMVH